MDSTLIQIFEKARCVHLKRWLPDVELQALLLEIEQGQWIRDEQTSDNFLFDRLEHEGIEQSLNERVMALAPLVSMLLDGQKVKRFQGTLKRMRAGPQYRFPWHSDRSGGRLMGLSLCVVSVDGGAFELRKKWSKTLLARLDDLNPGDVHLFDVQDSTLVLRVSPVLSPGERVFSAGWFHGD